MNKATIIGNLVRDPDSRTTQAGKQVCHFTIAVNRRNQSEGQPDADYFDITTFSALAENCARYLRKGKKVCVVGPVSASVYKAQNGETRAQLQVMAQEVEFLTPANTTEEAEKPAPATQRAPAQAAPSAPPGGGYVQVEDEDLPF